ncbi:MAG: hypothetical protein KDH90_05685, partial [Anaerolineae bacterium]|nr:hypothetical protein [Anaerolineae bacterium]
LFVTLSPDRAQYPCSSPRNFNRSFARNTQQLTAGDASRPRCSNRVTGAIARGKAVASALPHGCLDHGRQTWQNLLTRNELCDIIVLLHYHV